MAQTLPCTGNTVLIPFFFSLRILMRCPVIWGWNGWNRHKTWNNIPSVVFVHVASAYFSSFFLSSAPHSFTHLLTHIWIYSCSHNCSCNPYFVYSLFFPIISMTPFYHLYYTYLLILLLLFFMIPPAPNHHHLSPSLNYGPVWLLISMLHSIFIALHCTTLHCTAQLYYAVQILILEEH